MAARVTICRLPEGRGRLCHNAHGSRLKAHPTLMHTKRAGGQTATPAARSMDSVTCGPHPLGLGRSVKAPARTRARP